MIRLETAPHCGQSPRIAFLLEELGMPYALVVRPDGHFLEVYGRTGPRLVHDGLALFESGAILRHLARTSGDLLPSDLGELALCDAWIDFSGLRVGLPFAMMLAEMRSGDSAEKPARIALARKLFETGLAALDAHLRARDYLLDRFSLADCSMAALATVARAFPLTPWPNVAAYVARITQRPAFVRAVARLTAARAAPGRTASPEEVLAWWFGDPPSTQDGLLTKVKRWFQGGPGLDAEIIERFGATVEAALDGELDAWAETPRGRLALILVLDQLTRNCYRGTPRTYAGDEKARGLALEAIERREHEALTHLERLFVGMPLHHAEDLAIQQRALAHARDLVASLPPLLALVGTMHVEQSIKYNDVIARFGRFPHRNQVLGRTSTPEELEFLEDWPERAPPSAMRAQA